MSFLFNCKSKFYIIYYLNKIMKIHIVPIILVKTKIIIIQFSKLAYSFYKNKIQAKENKPQNTLKNNKSFI